MTVTAKNKKPPTAEQKRLLSLENRLIRAIQQCKQVADTLKSVSAVLVEMSDELARERSK